MSFGCVVASLVAPVNLGGCDEGQAALNASISCGFERCGFPYLLPVVVSLFESYRRAEFADHWGWPSHDGTGSLRKSYRLVRSV